jgi:hypothetical protein
MEVFADPLDPEAHDKFEKWRDRHLRGYVVSSRSKNNAMLHRADCGHLVFSPNDNVSLTAAPKYCSTDKRELENWARENMDKKLKRCRSCM